MSKEELNRKLREEAARSEKNAKKRPANAENSRRQQKIAEKTRTQLPPQSPNRKKREEEAKKRAERELREKKRKRRSGSNIVYYIMFALLAAIIFSVLSVTVLFNTEKIVIEGESDYSDEQIIAASGLKGDENLVRLSLAGIPEKMLDKLVTLDSVTIEKVFPSSIRIKVTRSVPMASFRYANQNYIISHIGRVMYIDTRNTDCMQVIGYKPADTVIVGGFIKAEDEEQDKMVKDISAALEKANITDITLLDITDNLSVKLIYDDRVEINLGPILQLDEKMRIIHELLYNGHIAETEHVSLDVSDVKQARQRPITSAPVTAAPVTSETEEGEGGEEAAETTEAA